MNVLQNSGTTIRTKTVQEIYAMVDELKRNSGTILKEIEVSITEEYK